MAESLLNKNRLRRKRRRGKRRKVEQIKGEGEKEIKEGEEESKKKMLAKTLVRDFPFYPSLVAGQQY